MDQDFQDERMSRILTTIEKYLGNVAQKKAIEESTFGIKEMKGLKAEKENAALITLGEAQVRLSRPEGSGLALNFLCFSYV